MRRGGRMADGLAGTVQRAEALVRADLEGNDGSHDWWHVARVRASAAALAAEEGGFSAEELRAVELAALMHDVKDYKYSGDVAAGETAVREFLENDPGATPGLADLVAGVVARVGFKETLKGGAKKAPLEGAAARILAVVTDADRLDAVGAIGVGRTFSYGGAKRAPMHVPGVEPQTELTQQAYVEGHANGTAHVDTTVNHFHEKLLKLKDLMLTEAGRRRAQGRHDFMLAFLEQFHREWAGEA